LISNEDLINELKVRPHIGNTLLVKKFYEPMVSTVSKRYKLDRLDSEYAVNESLLKVINKINTYEYESESKFFNWMYTIIKNSVLDLLKKKKQQRQKLNTISRDERLIPIEAKKNEVIDEDVFNSDISYSIEKENTDKDNIDELIDKNTALEYFNSYSKSADGNTNEQMEDIIEILQEFTLEEQCCITMRADNISMKDIAKIRNSNVVATKQYVSRLMKKFFKKAAERLNINNYKELYENFKDQDKLSNPPSDFREETAKS